MSVTEVLAVDPGLRYPAAALFRDGRLVCASRVKLPGKWAAIADPAERVRLIAGEVGHWWAGRAANPAVAPELAWERPQVYRAGRSKGDPNDLIPLAMLGGHVAGVLGCTVVRSYTPHEWAHGTTKSKTGDPWDSPRGGRLRRLLDADELAAVVPSHDAIDALGIGLNHLGRFAAVRIISRS